VLRVYVAINGRLAGIFTFGDALRPDAAQVCQDLRNYGITRIVMLTGDDTAAAMRIAANLPIDKVIANASPADKLAVVSAERAEAPVMMVGDGINDAPALAAANVGIAMGARGATAASQAADVIILANRLQLVSEAVLVAHRSMRIAKQSIFIGLGLAGTGMIFAAFGYIPPVTGALLQEGIDIAVILNALRALGEVSHFRRRKTGASL
jgi:P-type E1-E2 ATPase